MSLQSSLGGLGEVPPCRLSESGPGAGIWILNPADPGASSETGAP